MSNEVLEREETTLDRTVSNFKLLEDYLIAKPLYPKLTSKGGILLPDSYAIRPTQGVVVNVGEGKIISKTGKKIPMTVKIGDVILWKRYVGHGIGNLDGYSDFPRYLILKESSDILLIVENVNPELDTVKE